MPIAATKPLPRPRAIIGAVSNDVESRTLVVRRPKDTSGYAAFLWRQAHEQLVWAEERGWYNSDANVRCSAPGHRELVSATPGKNLELHFHFPAGTSEGKVYTNWFRGRVWVRLSRLTFTLTTFWVSRFVTAGER